MKRIWFGAGLLAGLLVLGILSSLLMERIHQPQVEKLNRAAALAAEGDWAGARDLSAEARAQWDKRQLLIAALCDHSAIDHIDGLFAQLEVFSQARSAASYSSTCVYLACQLEALSKSHTLNLQNFF